MSPISGLRFSKTFGVDFCFPVAEDFYREFSTVVGKEVFHKQRMTRIFRSSDIREAFLAKLNRGYYGDFVDRVNPPGALGGAIQDEHGSMVFTGARLDVATLLEEMHLRFDQQSVLCREPFQHQEMRFEAGGRVMWRGQEFSAVILRRLRCRGESMV